MPISFDRVLPESFDFGTIFLMGWGWARPGLVRGLGGIGQQAISIYFFLEGLGLRVYG